MSLRAIEYFHLTPFFEETKKNFQRSNTFKRKDQSIRQAPRRTRLLIFQISFKLGILCQSATSTSWSRTTRINYAPRNVHRYRQFTRHTSSPNTSKPLSFTWTNTFKHFLFSQTQKSPYCVDRFDTRSLMWHWQSPIRSKSPLISRTRTSIR